MASSVEVPQGAAHTIYCTAIDKITQEPLPLAGATITFSLKVCGTDEEILLSKVSTDDEQIEITDAANGLFRVYILSPDTAALDIGSYRYDVWIEFDADHRYAYARGAYLEIT